MQFYPELRGGRFAVIADFEDVRHNELFQVVNSSGKGACVPHPRRGREETGKHCMEFTAAAQGDAVVISDRPQGAWHLKRDWRAYDVLLLSVESPKQDLALGVSIAGGPPEQRMKVSTVVPLQRGWNMLRFDLAEMGEKIPLDDIREVRLHMPGLLKRTKLRIDDILLTGDRETLSGNPKDASGRMYVERVGQRWNIGAGGRFELTFSNGQVTGWHNLARDPHRLMNLTAGTVLGPSPVPTASSMAEARDYSAWGSAVAVRQRIVEMNDVRVILEVDWRFSSEGERAIGESASFQWRYVIYPTGQVYVTVAAAAPTGLPAKPLGLAVSLSSAPQEPIETVIRSADLQSDGKENDRQEAGALGVARIPSADSFLLFTVTGDFAAGRMIERRDELGRETSIMYVDEAESVQHRRWRSHLLLGGSAEAADGEWVQRATFFADPPRPEVMIGQPAIREPAPGGVSWFDLGEGCYVVAPDGHRVRLVMDGRERPIFSPAFRIAGVEDRDAWVYVDHLILTPTATSSTGELIFQLPGTIRRRVLVEVHFGSGMLDTSPVMP